MSAAFCAYCGKAVVEGANFCVGCGKPVAGVGAAQNTQQPPTGVQQYEVNARVAPSPQYGGMQQGPAPQQYGAVIQPIPPQPYANGQVLTAQQYNNVALHVPNSDYATPYTRKISFFGLFGNYFFGGFGGRCSLLEWWLTIIVIGLLNAVICAASAYAVFYFLRYKVTYEVFYYSAYSIFTLINFLPGLMMNSRRLHDIGISGWYQLLFIIPLLGWLFALALFVIPGSDKHNCYG